MSLDHFVELPHRTKPKFPDCCVLCEMPRPGRQTTFWTLNLSAKHENFIRWTKAPACRSCALALHFRRWLGLGGLILVGVAGVAAFELLPEDWRHGPEKKLLMGLFAIPVVLVYVIWWCIRPATFDVSVNEKDTSYHFKSAKSAEAFRELNKPPLDVKAGDKPALAADDMAKIRALNTGKNSCCGKLPLGNDRAAGNRVVRRVAHDRSSDELQTADTAAPQRSHALGRNAAIAALQLDYLQAARAGECGNSLGSE
jgi:hypothetical protein